MNMIAKPRPHRELLHDLRRTCEWLLLLFLLCPSAFCQPVVIATIGDYGTGDSNEMAVANLVKSWDPDFVLSLGDNNYGGTNYFDTAVGQFYHEFVYPYSGSYGSGASTNRFWPCLGNHDWGYPFPSFEIMRFYLDYFQLPGNERYYNYRYGPVEIFAIDSEGLEPDGFSSDSVQ